MREAVKELNEYKRRILASEDTVEFLVEKDKEICAEIGRDIEDLLDGRCASCGRIYYASHLVGLDYSENPPPSVEPEKGDCIPCWREKHDLPKLTEDEVEEIMAGWFQFDRSSVEAST